MSYSSTCAANPTKTECPFGCPCQGHYKVYPNQDCRCAEDARARAHSAAKTPEQIAEIERLRNDPTLPKGIS